MPHTTFLHTLCMVLIFRTDSSDMTNARTKVGDDQEEEEGRRKSGARGQQQRRERHCGRDG